MCFNDRSQITFLNKVAHTELLRKGNILADILQISPTWANAN